LIIPIFFSLFVLATLAVGQRYSANGSEGYPAA